MRFIRTDSRESNSQYPIGTIVEDVRLLSDERLAIFNLNQKELICPLSDFLRVHDELFTFVFGVEFDKLVELGIHTSIDPFEAIVILNNNGIKWSQILVKTSSETIETFNSTE